VTAEKPERRLPTEGLSYARARELAIDWWPYGEAAFAEARRRGCPLLVVIVDGLDLPGRRLDDEVLADPDLAASFARLVAVRVDPARRPDVDAELQRLVAREGDPAWPLVALLDGAGGALAIHPRPSRREVTALLALPPGGARAALPRASAEPPTISVNQYIANLLRPGAARALLGLRPRPTLLALVVALAAGGDSAARDVARALLGSLLASGLRDPLDGAFHGAAAEPRWVVPAFERRLADQAAMIALLVEAAAALGPAAGDLLGLAAASADWALTHLDAGEARTASRGLAATAFAYDEASWATWTVDELAEALPDATLFSVAQRAFDVWDRGELASDPRKNVLYAAESPARVARELGLTVDEGGTRLAEARALLRAARASRPQPPRDGPPPVAELAAFASALARLAAATNDRRYATSADALTAALADRVSDDGIVPHLVGGAHVPGESDLLCLPIRPRSASASSKSASSPAPARSPRTFLSITKTTPTMVRSPRQSPPPLASSPPSDAPTATRRSSPAPVRSSRRIFRARRGARAARRWSGSRSTSADRGRRIRRRARLVSCSTEMAEFTPRFLRHRGITIIQKRDPSLPRLRPSKVGLVLAGGAVSGGAFKAGGLLALDEALESRRAVGAPPHPFGLTQFDVFVGLSAGSVLASVLSAGISPSEVFRILDGTSEKYETFRPWHFMRPNLEAPSRWALTARREEELFTNWLSGATDSHTGGRFSLRKTLAKMWESLGRALPTGLFDPRALEAYLKRQMARAGIPDDFTRAFKKTGKALYLTATDLSRGELVVFGHDEPYRKVPISTAIASSCALPGWYRPMLVRNPRAGEPGEPDVLDLVDGGLLRTANVRVAAEKGCELIVCYNPFTRIRYDRAGRNLYEHGLPSILSQSARTLIGARLDLAKEVLFLDPTVQADVVFIEPAEDDYAFFGMGALNFWAKGRAANHGYAAVQRSLVDAHELLESLFQPHGISLRQPAARRSLDESDLTVQMRESRGGRLP
jgi:predicted acylesterase/phospholipase RssA